MAEMAAENIIAVLENQTPQFGQSFAVLEEKTTKVET